MIPFTKAHACGNDFLIVTDEAAAGHDFAALARRLCDRHTGVGADGIEFFAWKSESGPGPRSGRIRLHNADGSIAEISGNGTRCVAAWMAEFLGSKPGDTLEITTDAGLRVCRIDAVRNHDDFTVEVTAAMGVPRISPRAVELAGGAKIKSMEVSIGNPHFVVFSPSASEGTARRLGPSLERHPHFGAARTNVELCAVEAASLRLFVWERGSGFTQACGTGACAAAVAAVSQGLLPAGSEIAVDLPGGRLHVSVAPDLSSVSLRGPAQRVYTGELSNEALGERA